ncbi:MAG: hypothetical protein ABIA75_14565, partial [Candidatus Neomarinimicrobiota bacterium]
VLNAISDYTKIDNLFRQPDRVDNSGRPQPAKTEPAEAARLAGASLGAAASTVLSQSELRTLAALFGAQSGSEYTFYGNNRVHRAQAGHLLDIRG